MLGISRFSASAGLGMDLLGEALLSLSFLRTGVRRMESVDGLTDHMRRDVGLPPREAANPRDLRW
jgi:hypothetical protein